MEVEEILRQATEALGKVQTKLQYNEQMEKEQYSYLMGQYDILFRLVNGLNLNDL